MITIRRWTGREARALRQALRMSVRGFATYLGVGMRTVASWDAGGEEIVPRPEMQAALDTALERANEETKIRFATVLADAGQPPLVDNGPDFAATGVSPAVEHRAAATRDTDPWQTIELLRRIQASDTTPGTLESLAATAYELCCQYTTSDAAELRADAQGWLTRVERLLRRPVGLRPHRELLVSAGWLALLIGCLEYDMGMRAAAEATRAAARQLGDEAGNAEIVGWTYEMSAWFALTQGRYPDVVRLAQVGQEADRDHSVVVQLMGQEAKAYGRMGNIPDLRQILERGQHVLQGFPRPSRTEHHFIVDPDKWEFYAMDAYRLAGDDEMAEQYAEHVLAKGMVPDGAERSPMRMAEARLTLGVVAARKDELEQAVASGLTALRTPRRSLPSLLIVAGELDGELSRRFPDEPVTAEFQAVLRSLRSPASRRPPPLAVTAS